MNGQVLKEAAHAALESRRASLLLRARRAFLLHALEHGEVTADDVRAVIALPPDIDPKALGPIPTPLARSGIVQRTGFKNSVRAESHARPISIWQLVDPAKAAAWLEANPAPARLEPDPPITVDNTGQRLLFDFGQPSAASEG